MDRDLLVLQLTELGFFAQARDWALGQTIFVSHPSLAESAAGLEVYCDGLYLRWAEEQWLVTELSLPGRAEPHASFVTWDAVLGYLRA